MCYCTATPTSRRGRAFGDGNLYLNPGSLSIPKENSPHSYMTLEDSIFQWKELASGEVYHEIV